MADVNANISVNIDTSTALAELKSLQRQLALFHSSVAKSSAAASLAQGQLQRELLNTVNATGKFAATMVNIRTSTESFTHALETNKLGMREYFRYAGGATRTFGRLFKSEFDTIGKVSEERVKKMQTQYIKMGRDANGVVKAMAIKPLVLDMSDYGTQTQLAAQRQALFNQLVRQGSTNLLNFGKNTQWAGRQLMVGFTIPLMAVATQSARTFMEMEAAALKFRKVYGDLFTPQAETQQALANVKELGAQFTQYGIAVSDTVALAAEAAAAGFQGVDLQRQTTEATRLSVLGQIESQQALETTISLQNAFRMSSEDLASSIDFLNAVENQTVTSLDDITTAIPKVAPVIQQLGGDVKDLAFLLTAMKEGGVNASEGANALKSGLAALINPTKRASDMLAGMGINITKIIESNQGNLRATVVEFAQALDRLDPLTRARAIEQLFGKFQFARLSTLFDNVIRQGNQASRVLDLAGSSVEDLAALSAQELGMTADSAMNKFRKSVEDLKLALQPVGEVFLQVVTPIIEFFGNILEKFSGLSDRAKRFITLMVVGIGGLGPVLLMTFGLLANGLANIIKLFLNLRNGYLRLSGQSQILGEQTNYLTAEQLEAATVAASLNQSHSNLTQTFTLEASAVNALRNAYLDANLAAKEFATRNPGMMLPKRAKGYASGIVSVPGPKGAGDVVPAMLSPGEAVIPSDMAKKYAPLIQGMIANNIPGYIKGKPGRGASGRVGKSNVTVLRGMQANISNAGGLVGFAGLDATNISDITSIYVDEILKQARLSLSSVSQEIRNWENVNKTAIISATQAVNAGVPAQEAYADLNQKFKKDMMEASGPVAQFTQTAETMMPELSQDLINAQNYAKSMSLNLKDADDAIKLSQGLPGNIFAQKAVKPGNYQLRSRARGAATSIFGGPAGIPLYGVPGFMMRGVEPNTPAYNIRSSQEHFAQTKLQQENLLQNQEIRRKAKQDAMSYSGGLKQGGLKDIYEQSRNRRSPHPLASQDGRDDAIAYNKAAQSRGTLYGGQTGRIDPIEKSIRRQREKTIGDVVRERVINKNLLNDQIQQEKQARLATMRMAKFNTALMSGMFALTSLGGVASMAGGNIGRLGEIMFQISGPLFALSSLLQVFTGTQMLSLLKQFPLRFGAAAVAIGGLTAAIKIINSTREKERLAIEGLADAATLTTEKVKTLGDYFNITPNKLPSEMAGISAFTTPINERTRIEGLKANEGFQKQFAPNIKNLRNATDEQARLILESMAILLRGQGFAKDQVNIILKAIAEEAGKSTVKLDFKKLDISTQDGQQQIVATTNEIINNFNKAFATGIEKKFARSLSSQKVISWIELTKEQKQQIKTAGKELGNILSGLAGQFKLGIINASTYNEMTKSLLSTISDTEQGFLLLRSALSSINPEFAKATLEVKDFKSQALLLRSAIFGLQVAPEILSDLINGDAIQQGRARYQLEQLATAAEKAQQVMNDKTNKTGGTGRGLLDILKERILATQEQTKAFIAMRKAGIDAATAQELAADPELRTKLVAAAKAGKKAWMDATAAIKSYAAEQKKLNQMLVAGQDQGDYEKSRLEMAQKYIDLQEHIIDMQNQPQLQKYDAEITSINNQLDDIKIKEDQINENYNKQTNALNKIKSINENINNLQKQRLSIADALTRGDISAAAQAIQDARAQQSSMSMEVSQQALELGRDNAIAALGKKELETQLTLLQKQKKALEDNIQLEKDRIKYLGMTKNQIDNAVKALDLAKSAEIDISDPNFLNNILKGAKGDAGALEEALKKVAQQAKEAFTLLTLLRSKQIEQPTYTGSGAGYYIGGGMGGYDAAGRYVGTPFGQAMYGGFIKRMAPGGIVNGTGMTDKVPTLLTPGEFVINKNAAQRFAPLLNQINESKYPDSLSFGGTPVVTAATNTSVNNSNTVYNYSLSVTANTDGASPDDIARTVISHIRNLDAQRLRSNR